MLPDLGVESNDLALVHTEPVQVINRADGTVAFIDIEGIGMGSKYQDLGFIYYSAAIAGSPTLFERVLSGYSSEGIDMKRVMRFAGVISVAYSTFADSTSRIDLGLQLLGDAQQS